MISRGNISSPYVFLQSFDGGETWQTMPGSQITTTMISVAGNPQINDMRVFHSLNGEIVWVYQRREVVFNPVFAINYTLYFHFSTNNGVTWDTNIATIPRLTNNEINSLTMHSSRRFLDQQNWFVSFPDTNETWIVSPNFTERISNSVSVTTATKLEQSESSANYSSSFFSSILDKDGSNPNSNFYSNDPLQALQFQNIFQDQLPIYAKASAYLDTTFAVLGFFNGYRLLESSDADGTSWAGQGDFLNFQYYLNQGTSPLSFHLLPLIEDEINNQKWFLPYIISTGGISAPYSYSIGSIFDNNGVTETENDLRFSNCPRFSTDRAAKSVLMMADNKLYHVQGQNSYNQSPLLKLLTTFTGNSTICEYVGPRLITDNFDRNPGFVDGSLRGWTITPALISGGFPPQPLGPTAALRYDSTQSLPALRISPPQGGSAPSYIAVKLTYEFSPPFWWQGGQFDAYQRTLFGFSIQGNGQSSIGDQIDANVKLITNGILDTNNPTTINAPIPLTNDRFGSSVAGGYSHIAVGAPLRENAQNDINVGAVYLYDNDGNFIRSIDNPDPSYFDNGLGEIVENTRFGSGVALLSGQTPSDQYVIITSPYHDVEYDIGGGNLIRISKEGQVYVFDVSTGQVVHILKGGLDYERPNSNFGFSILAFGPTLFVGAPNSGGIGRVFVYDIQTGQRTAVIDCPVAVVDLQFGYAMSLGPFGSILISAPNGGSGGRVYRFSLFGGYNLLDTILDPDTGTTGFGESLASNGIYSYIGSPSFNGNTGKVSVYFSDQTMDLVKTISNPGGGAGPFFGKQILISNSVYISAPEMDTGSGVVYTYVPPSFSVVDNQVVHSDPVLKATLTNPNAFNSTVDDNFGLAMALSSDGLIIAAPGDDGGVTKTQAGTIYTYKVNNVESYNQTFGFLGSPFFFSEDVLVELPGAIEGFGNGARLEIDVGIITAGSSLNLYNLFIKPIPLPGPIESAETVFKFNYNSFSNFNDPNLPVDLGPNAWTYGNTGSSGQSGLSVVPSGGPYDGSSYYRNNNAGNGAGIETLRGSTGIGTYWDNNLIGQSWTFETNIRLNSSITSNGIYLMKSVGTSNLLIRENPLNNTLVQIVLQYANSSNNNSGSRANVVQFDKTDFDVGPWHHLVIEYFRASDTGRTLSVWLNGVRASNTIINAIAADDFYSGYTGISSYEGIIIGSLPFGDIDFGLDNTRLILGTPYRTLLGEGNFIPPTKPLGDPTPL